MYKAILKSLREEKNTKQKDIANILDIEFTTYSSYESEYDMFPTKHLNTICNYFNVSLDYMFGFTKIKNYNNNNGKIDINISGKRIKEFRKENNITQAKMAKLLNTTQSMLSFYENSKNVMPLIHIYFICTKYKISADYLLGKTDEPKYF